MSAERQQFEPMRSLCRNSPRHDVEEVARAAIRAPTARLLEYREVPLDYDAYLPGRWVARVEGTAAVEGSVRGWSAIRKWTDPPSRTAAAPHERGRREALAYRSGLLPASGPLRVPRAYRIELAGDGAIDLWLEDVVDAGADPWSLTTFGHAARALGAFNALALSGGVPQHDWLVRDWAERQSEPLDVPSALAEIDSLASSPDVVRRIGGDAGRRARRMLLDQPALKSLLHRLPQVLCHHDAARSNLVARRRSDGKLEIVAFDWELVGPGAIGADVATLVSGSVRKGDVCAEDLAALDATVFAGYQAGLRDVGWVGDAQVARLGYCASLALRAWFVRDTLRNLGDRSARLTFGRARATNPDQVLQAFAALSRFLLDRADEARSLAGTVGPA